MVWELDAGEYCRGLRGRQPPYPCPAGGCPKAYRSLCGLQYHLSNFRHGQARGGAGEPSGGRFVEVELEGRTLRVGVDEALPVVSGGGCGAGRKGAHRRGPGPRPPVPLPEPNFRLLEDYALPDAPPRPPGYVRFIEKSPEEADGEVEYDLDEEDTAWLELANGRRREAGLDPVPVQAFELLMDRLEKESYFRAKEAPAVVDEDAVCCICLDGDCQNSNAILFCDMCNMAVHQDCYGVPFIPEEQWICRRCLHSPSRPVDCVLCPDTGGAFKQTDRNHWVHVVCALWIPEVRFANAVFLEPVDSIETIPAARWRLDCCLCRLKGVGACIQCHKPECYTAFHVTCAQRAGFYMVMHTLEDSVEKVAYCAAHTPPGVEKRPDPPVAPVAPYSVSVPTIPPDKIREIGDLLGVQKKNVFVRRLIAYWTLKRQMRNGVPLLRSLRASRSQPIATPSVDAKQLKFWYRFRQDLERARLLCELVRKRERLKREQTRVAGECLEVRLVPGACVQRRVLQALRAHPATGPGLLPLLSSLAARVDDFEFEGVLDFARALRKVLQEEEDDLKIRAEELVGEAEEDLARLRDHLGLLPPN